MATVYPFRALRPRPELAARVAAVPYDVVSTEEARSLAAGNPLSFLHVSRAEIDLPAGVDPHADAVYDRAVQNFSALKEQALVVEDAPSLYAYRLRMGSHSQTGLAASFSIDDYERDVIKKHERTRRDKEDDRTRHMIALGAQTGPVFLTYRASPDVDAIVTRATNTAPLFDFAAADNVQHTIWPIGGADRDALVESFARIPAFYIADGHHRAASAARSRAEKGTKGFLAVAFPHNQVQILPYNRVVKDLAGRTPDAFLQEVKNAFTVQPGPPTPTRRGEIAMYLSGTWHSLRSGSNSNGVLDVTLLQDRLLAPILGIADIRTDKRIDFVGGARGTSALEAQVQSGDAAVAFSLFPVSLSDLMAVSDAGGIMPPKSTWFEPKLRDGLLIQLL